MWAEYWDVEAILSIFGNCVSFPRDAIQLYLHSVRWFLTHFDLNDLLPPLDLEVLPDELLACQSKFEKFVELCKRLKIDPSFTQPDGSNLLHWIIKESENFVRTRRLKHCLSLLITHDVDPCAVCDGYLTPTLVAFLDNGLDPWFTTLRQLGINVEAVAAHALGRFTGANLDDITTRLTPNDYLIRCRFASQDRDSSIFEDLRKLRADLIEAFEGQGCYLSESGDRGNTVTHKASSSVDFKPSTVYDPERAKQDFRRRTEGQKHPQ